MPSLYWIKKAPWAALIAAVLVIWVDSKLFADRELWLKLRARLEALPEPIVRLELGMTKDILQLKNMRDAAPEMRRLIILGNSRARVGLNLRNLRDDDILQAKIAHAGVSPYVMRTFAKEGAALSPDLVVLMLSELDTHRPVELVPGACFRSAPALGQLLTSEPSLSWEQRHEVEQVAVGTFLNSYRYGDILDRAYLNDFLDIRIQEEEPASKRQDQRRGRVIPRKRLVVEAENARFRIRRISEPDVPPPPIENIEEIRAEFAKSFKRKKIQNSTLNIGYAIAFGPHVETQRGLIEKTIEILTDAGSKVLIVEGPLNPLTYMLYDEEATRSDFLAFVEEMKVEYGVHFQSIDETGPYVPKDFSDLLHLKGTSARKLSAEVRKRVVQLLDG